MTTPTAPAPSVTPTTAPDPAPLRGRRRPMLITLGVLLMLVGGLGAWWWASTQSDAVEVLIVSQPVPRGEAITAEDLSTINITESQTPAAIPVGSSGDVIGQIAASDLPVGTLITPDLYADTVTIEDGQSLVGLSLTPAQVPATPLVAGDTVRIVTTPIAQGEIPSEAPATISATVYATSTDATTGAHLVTVTLESTKAADLAAWAATQRIALIVDPTTEVGAE